MSQEKQNHVKKNKRQIIIYLLFAFVSISAQGSPDFVLKGDARPAARDTLQVSSVNDMSHYTFKWTRGDALGTFEGVDGEMILLDGVCSNCPFCILRQKMASP